MPYVFYEEVPEGAEEADVVTRENYNLMVDERDELATQNASLAESLEQANSKTREVQKKYADALLGSQQKQREQPKPKTEKLAAQSFSELFG